MKSDNWLQRQIAQAKKELAEWPKWMRDTIKEEKPINVEGNSTERVSEYCKNLYNQKSFSEEEDYVEQDREFCQYTVSTAPLCSISPNCYYCKFKPRLDEDNGEEPNFVEDLKE